MTPLDSLRASDAEREQTAQLLRDHCAAGRIAPEELAERLDGVYASRTLAELEVLLDDLPAAAPAPAEAPDLARARVLHAVGLVVLVNVACVATWLATGAAGSFWPKWVLLASVIRLAFTAWSELGPGARRDEARLGRGGSAGIDRR